MKQLQLSDLEYGSGSLSYTGSRFLTSVSKQTLLDNLPKWGINFSLGKINRFCFGAAPGVDTVSGEWCTEHFPFVSRLVVVPGKRDKVDWSFKDWATHVFYMPENTTYKDRNQMLVNLSYYIAGFPNRGELDDPRSGTWQCIRQARKARRKIFIKPLNNDEPIWE